MNQCKRCNKINPGIHTCSPGYRDKEGNVINVNSIVSVKTFPGEYTAIQCGDRVKRVNYLCNDCGIDVSNFTQRDIEGAYTSKKGLCDFCKEEKYIHSVRDYLNNK